MKYSIIIPTKNPHNLAISAGSTLSNNDGRLIVVDDFDEPNRVQVLEQTFTSTEKTVLEAEAKAPDESFSETDTFDVLAGTFRQRYVGRIVKGVKPFCFSRNVNLGIRAAGDDDVILMNDDAVLCTVGGFDAMMLAANSAEGRQYGAISARILGMAAAPEQCAGGARAADLPRAGLWKVRHHMIAFMCVYIRRAVLDQVGLLDEAFVGYGYEDDDYCRRLREAGLELGVFDPCLVEHEELPSTYRGKQAAGFDLLAENRRVFQQKWGIR